MIFIQINQEVSMKVCADQLCSAFEGGSNYWIDSIDIFSGKEKAKPWGDEYTPSYISTPFEDGGYLTITDNEEGKAYILNMESIKKGIQIMAQKYPSHFSDMITENGDVSTGDIFLQCCIFGDVVFG